MTGLPWTYSLRFYVFGTLDQAFVTSNIDIVWGVVQRLAGAYGSRYPPTQNDRLDLAFGGSFHWTSGGFSIYVTSRPAELSAEPCRGLGLDEGDDCPVYELSNYRRSA